MTTSTAQSRARAIRAHGTVEGALAAGALPAIADVTAAEGLVLGLLAQGVTKYLVILGHGSTALAEVLRVYQEEGTVRTFQCRNEVAMAHAATALRWHYGETPALLTSIGPGALQALAGSLTSASNCICATCAATSAIAMKLPTTLARCSKCRCEPRPRRGGPRNRGSGDRAAAPAGDAGSGTRRPGSGVPPGTRLRL